MASYATPADLIARKDVRVLGDLVGDDGVRIDPASLLTDANLQAALDDASGELEAAFLAGKRYSVADLNGLTGNSAAYLVRLCCDIAFGLLWERRPWLDTYGDLGDRAQDKKESALRRLRTGEDIFNLEAARNASVPKITSPTVVERNQLNLVSHRLRGKFYPREVLPE